MTTAEFKEEVLKRIDRVPPERYEFALAQLEGMAERPRGTPLRDLRRFSGSISQEAGEAMKKVIMEECRRIDYESWGLAPGALYVTDAAGNNTRVILELDRYRELLDACDELDAIRAYDEAKASHEASVSLEDALREIDQERRPSQ